MSAPDRNEPDQYHRSIEQTPIAGFLNHPYS